MILEKHAIAKLCQVQVRINAVQAALAEVASAVVRLGSWHFDAISIVWHRSVLSWKVPMESMSKSCRYRQKRVQKSILINGFRWIAAAR